MAQLDIELQEKVEQHDGPIEIIVVDPQQQNGQIDKFTIYTIKGRDKLGIFETQRRFKDFVALREVLIMKWPGCFVPGLPGRKMFSGNDARTINDRIKFLNAFCYKLSKLTVLYYSQEVSQLFLRSKDKELYKTLEQIHKPNAIELIQKYQIHFGQLQGKDIDQNLQKNIEDFADQVKLNQEQLRKAKKFVRETLESQGKINDSMDLLLNTHIPDYERQFIAQYCNSEKLLLLCNDQNKEYLRNTLKSTVIFKRINLWMFLDLIRVELKDCKAFLQQIKIKHEYEEYRKKLEVKAKELQLDLQNANEGKTSFLNIFKKQNPEEIKSQISLQIQTTQNEIENNRNLIDIICAILGFIEIEKYQQEKKMTYEDILQQLQEVEQTSIREQELFWSFIKEQSFKLQQQFVENNKIQQKNIQQKEYIEQEQEQQGQQEEQGQQEYQGQQEEEEEQYDEQKNDEQEQEQEQEKQEKEKVGSQILIPDSD